MARQPSLKQKRALDNMLENGGNMGKAMLDAGYSKSMAKNPQKLTESKGFMSIAEKISDEKLHTVLLEGLDALNNDKPDYAVRHKYLDTALKLKGAYETDENKNINILIPVLVKFLDKKEDETSNNGNTG